MKNSILNRKFKNDRYLGISVILLALNFVYYFTYIVCRARGGAAVNTLLLNTVLSLDSIVNGGKYWTLFTYPLAKTEVFSVLFHALFLYMFGGRFEQRIGSKEFLFFYLTSVLFCAGVHLLCSRFVYGPYAFLIGSEASVFALLFIYSMVYKYEYVYLFFMFPIRATFLVLILLLLDIVYLFAGAGNTVQVMINASGVLYSFAYAGIRMRLHPVDYFRSLFTGSRR